MLRVDEWRAIKDGRAFLTAIRAAAAVNNGHLPDDLAAHLDFVERRLDEGDPLRQVELVIPDVPEPTPDDLKPFLGDWSPTAPGSPDW